MKNIRHVNILFIHCSQSSTCREKITLQGGNTSTPLKNLTYEYKKLQMIAQKTQSPKCSKPGIKFRFGSTYFFLFAKCN